MKRIALFVLFFGLPVTASAAVTAGDFPEETVWYMHADLKEMRSTDSGRELYVWRDDEVLSEIKDEVGVDLKEEIDRITPRARFPLPCPAPRQATGQRKSRYNFLNAF